MKDFDRVFAGEPRNRIHVEAGECQLGAQTFRMKRERSLLLFSHPCALQRDTLLYVVQRNISFTDGTILRVGLDTDCARARYLMEIPKTIIGPECSKFDDKRIVPTQAQQAVENKFFLRLMMSTKRAYDMRHPIAVVAASNDFNAVVHDLYRTALGFNNPTGIRDLGDMFAVLAADGH
ncbi:hypothetical protein FHT86_005602 [Rhizobium sp. BK313]|nr:hypothetical protein [Rhizobium sp. BK313]